MTAMEWLTAYAEQLGIEPPTPDELDTLLELAAEAAHASERIAAPIACWLSARAGRAPEEAIALARAVAEAER
jgi:hypothetical protein